MLDVVFIDDSRKDIQTIEAIFSSNKYAIEHFHLFTYNVDDFLKIELKELPDLFLVDFHFDKSTENDIVHNGFVLSTILKNRFEELPIILFTRKTIFNIQAYPKNILNIVDDIIFKNEVISENNEALYKIFSLANGCNSLRSISHKNWEELLKLLNAPVESYDDLIVADRPNLNETSWKVLEISSWIRNIVINFPGILYNELYAATYLGISLRAFLEIREYFKSAQYSGIFRPYQCFYWKSILRSMALELMTSFDIFFPVNVGFRIAWSKKYNHDLEASKCIYSGDDGADRVCYILNQPVKTKYSFAYNIDNRPAVMDEARVSWQAIRTTNDVNEEFLGSIAREMLPQIKSK